MPNFARFPSSSLATKTTCWSLRISELLHNCFILLATCFVHSFCLFLLEILSFNVLIKMLNFINATLYFSRSQWPRGLRRGSTAARLLRLWVRIPPGAWMSVCCECCVLSGRDLCDKLITRPEESYRLWCVVVCDLETSRMRRPWAHWGLSRHKKEEKKK